MSQAIVTPVRPSTVGPFLRRYWAPMSAIGALVALGLAGRPNLALLAGVSLAVKTHLAAALAALMLGLVMMATRKGLRFHRTAGWVWVVIMTVTAASSLFITGLNGDHWSWIHALSFVTLATLPLAVVAARRHKVKQHRGAMMGMVFGGLVIAGLFTFVPGRLMFQMFFG